jgi:hypothetical protein
MVLLLQLAMVVSARGSSDWHLSSVLGSRLGGGAGFI